MGGGTSSDVYAASGLPLGALGLVGEAARLRYNNSFGDFRERLLRGVRSASNMSKVVTTNKDGYAQAEHASVRAMLALKDTWDGSPDYALLQDNGHSFSTANPLFGPPSYDKAWQAYTLLAGSGAGALGALYLDRRLATGNPLWRYRDDDGIRAAYREMDKARTWQEKDHANKRMDGAVKSKAALQSSRTAAMLKVAGGMSFTAAMGAMLWASAVVRSDEALDNHVDYWANMARELDDVFGAGDPTGREALAAAWAGEAMEAADKKLRAFMTAGIQLTDLAVAHAYDLAQAVEILNYVHDLAFALTVAEVMWLLCARLSYTINPVAALGLQEVIGRKLTMTIMVLHTMLVGVMGAVLYAGMNGQPQPSRPEGVPAQDFPMVEV
ncbi:MAG: hypothetical protein K0R62_2482 [Nonomuraea muscovyensis]|nr:hypothetical protein [Nonomuraea muscovyensis]